MATFLELKPSQLIPNKHNIRDGVGDVSSLAASIEKQGLMNPLRVTPNGKPDHYVVVAGHRRLAAVKKLKLKTVPCWVIDTADEADQIAAMLAENVERADLTPVEEAAGVLALFELGESQAAIVGRTGMSVARVRARKKIGQLPDEIKLKITEHEITLADAEFIANHADDPTDLNALEAALGTNNWLVAKQRQRDRDAERKRVAKLRKDIEKLGIEVVDDWAIRRDRKAEAATAFGVERQVVVENEYPWPAPQEAVDAALWVGTIAFVHFGEQLMVKGRFYKEVLVVYSPPPAPAEEPEPAADDSSSAPSDIPTKPSTPNVTPDADVTDEPTGVADEPTDVGPSAQDLAAVEYQAAVDASTKVRHQFIRDLIATGDEDKAVLATRVGAEITDMVYECDWHTASSFLPIDTVSPADRHDAAREWFTGAPTGQASLLMGLLWMTVLAQHDDNLHEGAGGIRRLHDSDLEPLIRYTQLLTDLGHILSDPELEVVDAATEALDADDD